MLILLRNNEQDLIEINKNSSNYLTKLKT